MKAQPFALLLPLLSVTALPLQADETYVAKTYRSGDESLLYRIHVPEEAEDEEKLPLLIFFHGAGERGDDNQRQLFHGTADIMRIAGSKGVPLIVVAPQCPNGQQWVDTPWGDLSHTMPKEPSAPMRLSIGLLKELAAELPVDPDRVYVSGLSMGGFGTWDIVQRMPDYFAAAIPVCGGGDTAEAAKLKDLPIWCFHGSEDGVVKPKRSRDMIAAIKEAGGDPKYTEYPGVGHNSWTATYRDPEVLGWLFKQRRK